MVAAMESVGRGAVEISAVERALGGEDTVFGLAHAENLCLMDIEYLFDFKVQCPKILRTRIAKREEDAFLRLDFYRDLASRCQSGV